MADKTGAQSDRMLRAAESGAAMKQRAHEGLMGQYSEGQRQGAQMAATMGGLAHSGEQLKQQGEQFDARHKLDLADRGFVEEGASPGDDRAAKLDAEMEKGAQQPGGVGSLDPEAQKRLRGQTSQAIEYDGKRYVPGPERIAAQETRQYQAETERIKAEAYRAQTSAAFNKERLKKDAADPEELKRLRSNLLQPIKSNVRRFERFQNGKQSEEDWASMAKMAQGNNEPGLVADLKAKQWTPRVQAFLNSAIAYDSLKFIGDTGDLPDGDMVDFSSPKMQEFTQATGQVSAYMKMMGPEFSQWLGIDSMGAKTSFMNKMAAAMVLSGMTQPGAYQPQGPMDGMTPSAGGGGEGREQMTQPVQEPPVNRGSTHDFATDDMTQQAIKARAAGRPMPPTDTEQFRDQAGGRWSNTGTDNALNRGIY